MSIVHMLSNELNEYQKEWPEGARCLLNHGYGTDESGRPHVIVIHETHHGRCLYETERNMRDDSDFFMHVWEDGQEKSIMFATTRGWSYPCFGSHVDATPEVIAEWKAWKAAKERREAILYRWASRKAEIETARESGLTRAEVRKLEAACSSNEFNALAKLLKANLRSSFKLSLREQALAWLREAKPKYNKPLSARQFACLMNR